MAELISLVYWDKDGWYRFAGVYAQASGKTTDKKEEYAARAVVALGKAVAAGFRDAARIDTDADLDPVRDRDDFKTLLADLRKKGSQATSRLHPGPARVRVGPLHFQPAEQFWHFVAGFRPRFRVGVRVDIHPRRTPRTTEE